MAPRSRRRRMFYMEALERAPPGQDERAAVRLAEQFRAEIETDARFQLAARVAFEASGFEERIDVGVEVDGSALGRWKGPRARAGLLGKARLHSDPEGQRRGDQNPDPDEQPRPPLLPSLSTT
jgi:hypothetical protein